MNTVSVLRADISAKRFFDAKECAARYGISWRTWLRLVDSGRAPQPTRFGRLVRWPLATLENWESNNCSRIRTMKGDK